MKKLTKKMITGALALSLLGTSSGTFAASYYTVQSGDTFWKIADKNQVSILDLMAANDANEGTVLDIGQKIIIPDQVQDDALYYEVKAGDTPWIISDKLGVNLVDLLAINDLGEGEHIYIGQKLMISSDIQVSEATYEVQSGDTPWIISNKFGVATKDLLAINHLQEGDMIYVGQKLIIPSQSEAEVKDYEVKAGDTPWIISDKLGVSLQDLLAINQLGEDDPIFIGQKLLIPTEETKVIKPIDGVELQQPESYITYKTHVIQKGENLWTLSVRYGVGFNELLKVNHATETTYYNVGDEVKIPVHVVPEMATVGAKYGEYLDWWQGAQYVVPIGAEVTIVDFYTGERFNVKRTIGANHADVETLTPADTQKLKEIFGGFSWAKRPVIVEYNGRRLAASLAAMPHAGNDDAKGGVETSWRSGNYDPGINLDYVKDNDMHGVIDLHFNNSTRHIDGQADDKHQNNVKIAAGIK